MPYNQFALTPHNVLQCLERTFDVFCVFILTDEAFSGPAAERVGERSPEP